MYSQRRHFNTEYWVPTKLTVNQLEMYCKILTDKSDLLCTQSKDPSVRGLRSILTTTQKCSIHLQVVERSPESSSTEAKQPNVEIAASGKLNLLGRMLEEINKQSLKALILYEEIGCSGSCIGGILDDFLLQKIGSDSYDHVGRDVIPAKRVAALNKFNAEHKKFVFLLEKHACLSVIRLFSVNTVLIFNSDWTPMKSLKALERIKPDSQPEQIKIFRLYSPFIVEENILCFAREKKI